MEILNQEFLDLVEDEALINRLGFNNHGAENVLDRIKSNKKLGLLGINIGPNKDSKID